MQRCLIQTFDVKGIFNLLPLRWHHFMDPLVAPAAQYIPPTSSFFYLFYEISVIQSQSWKQFKADKFLSYWWIRRGKRSFSTMSSLICLTCKEPVTDMRSAISVNEFKNLAAMHLVHKSCYFCSNALPCWTPRMLSCRMNWSYKKLFYSGIKSMVCQRQWFKFYQTVKIQSTLVI